MADRADITPELCRQLLRYEPETGKLFWKPRDVDMFVDGRFPASRAANAWNSKWAGREALACLDSKGYKSGHILRVRTSAHRAGWAVYYGVWPSLHIDHINGDRTDNRIENLRVVSCAENQRNQKRHSNNTSGVCGVWFDKRRFRWMAEIMVDYRKVHLGAFGDLEAATKARMEAEKFYKFHANHGTPTFTKHSPATP